MKETIQIKNTLTPLSYTPDKYNLFILPPMLINYCEKYENVLQACMTLSNIILYIKYVRHNMHK